MNPEGVHVSFASDPLRFIAPSAVHSSMNNRKIKLIAYIYIHFSLSLVEKSPRRSHLQQTENLHTVCVQTGERRRRLQRPIRLARFVFFDVKFGLRHVA